MVPPGAVSLVVATRPGPALAPTDVAPSRYFVGIVMDDKPNAAIMPLPEVAKLPVLRLIAPAMYAILCEPGGDDEAKVRAAAAGGTA